ncbi:Mov34-domain-containing protein [Lentinula edodes]|uniref:Mov34-domain-containing protein n=1 Tax=Lentinula edodes TaxID=5353 RepID=A0A1Q3ERU5_LENED|nr:Mov34-domain-containing protein [Lentinula edodes]
MTKTGLSGLSSARARKRTSRSGLRSLYSTARRASRLWKLLLDGSHLTKYPALIQNFYSPETALYQAVHISLDSGVELGQPADVTGYISSIFTKVKNPRTYPYYTVPQFDLDRSGVDLLTLITLSSLPSTSPSSTLSSPTTSLETLSSSIENIISMIDRVLTYVRAVLAGEARGNAAIGRYLMDTLGASTEGDTGVGGSAVEMGGFSGRLQDTLMVSYFG